VAGFAFLSLLSRLPSSSVWPLCACVLRFAEASACCPVGAVVLLYKTIMDNGAKPAVSDHLTITFSLKYNIYDHIRSCHMTCHIFGFNLKVWWLVWLLVGSLSDRKGALVVVVAVAR
jgi:hypothetical protein